MKTLRLLRNIAVLFILVALPASRRAAGNNLNCVGKPGYNGCYADKNGNCADVKCTPGSFCSGWGCGVFRPKT